MMKASSFKELICEVIHEEKKFLFGSSKYYSSNDEGIFITPITFDSVEQALIEKLTKWRMENQHGFIKIFNVTAEGTKKWLVNTVMHREDRLLFIIFDAYGEMIGHLGVSSFDYLNQTCEIDNVVRGEISKQSAIMIHASAILIDWVKRKLQPRKIRLRVLSDNNSALFLYHRLGFRPDKLEPLEKIQTRDCVEWQPLNKGKVDKFFLSMFINAEG